MSEPTDPAHSSGKTATRGRPFAKGADPRRNPSGRPRSAGLVQQIRRLTHDGDDLALYVHKVFCGKVKGAKLRDRMDAATWLRDTGFGRPNPAPDPFGCITHEQASRFVEAIAASVRRHVPDAMVLQAISAEIAEHWRQTA